jgi:hypothetical protein
LIWVAIEDLGIVEDFLVAGKELELTLALVRDPARQLQVKNNFEGLN